MLDGVEDSLDADPAGSFDKPHRRLGDYLQTGQDALRLSFEVFEKEIPAGQILGLSQRREDRRQDRTRFAFGDDDRLQTAHVFAQRPGPRVERLQRAPVGGYTDAPGGVGSRPFGRTLPHVDDPPVAHAGGRGRGDLDEVAVDLALERQHRLGQTLWRLVVDGEVAPQRERRAVGDLSGQRRLQPLALRGHASPHTFCLSPQRPVRTWLWWPVARRCKISPRPGSVIASARPATSRNASSASSTTPALLAVNPKP